MVVRQYFSATYTEACREFLEAAGAGGAAIESHVNPNERQPRVDGEVDPALRGAGRGADAGVGEGRLPR